MTKNEEKANFAGYIDSLPKDSYLHPIMKGIQVGVETAISNDFAFIDWNHRVEEQRIHEIVIKDLETKAAALKAEVRQLERQAEKLREGIDACRSEARRLAGF